MGNCISIMPTNQLIISIPTPSIIFTRYLYVKDEVKIALFSSLICKHQYSIFWAYELYYSGFEEELFELLWKIYYDLYATLNPAFRDYFIKKHKEWIKLNQLSIFTVSATTKTITNIEKDRIISTIVNNLIIRPYNLDIFMLIHVNKYNNTTENNENINNDLTQLLEVANYAKITKYILQLHQEYIEINLDIIIEFFIKKEVQINHIKFVQTWKKHSQFLNKTANISHQLLLLTIIMQLYSVTNNLKMGKKIYMCINPSDIEQYNTLETNINKISAYKILPLVATLCIDEFNHLSLFELNRNSLEEEDDDLDHEVEEVGDNEEGKQQISYANKRIILQKKYWYEWLYYASFSPIWANRIKKYNGKINHEYKKIEFIQNNIELYDDEEESFYEQFNYEPDEQKREIQNRNIGPIRSITNQTSFYNEFKYNSLYDPIQLQVNPHLFVL